MEHLGEEASASSLSNANFAPFRLIWGDLQRVKQVGTSTRLWLALESDWDSESGSADSVIHIPNSQNVGIFISIVTSKVKK
jgi:hypothetical protein